MCISSAIAVCDVDIWMSYFMMEAVKQKVGCLEILYYGRAHVV